MIKQFLLRDQNVKRLALAYISSLPTDGKKPLKVEIGESDEKTREQEEKYHAMIGDIARQCRHINKAFDAESWKRLLVTQFRKDSISSDIPRLHEYWQRNEIRLVPDLEGTGLVALGQQTRHFPHYVASAFIEWMNTYGAEHEVRWSASKGDAERWRHD